MSSFPPEECDDIRSQREFYEDMARAIDAEETRRPNRWDEEDR